VRIPRTKMGKTEEDDYTESTIEEEYGVTPLQLIEVKGLMGDKSDNIPGIPGVGEKTALEIIKHFKNIDNLYASIDKGEDTLILKPKLKEKIIENKELAYLSRTLGTIDINVPIEKDLSSLQKKEWDNEKVYEIFSRLKFNRFIERFELKNEAQSTNIKSVTVNEISEKEDIENITQKILRQKKMYYYFDFVDSLEQKLIIKKKISGIYILEEDTENVVYIKYSNIEGSDILKLFENEEIIKVRYKTKNRYVQFKTNGLRA